MNKAITTRIEPTEKKKFSFTKNIDGVKKTVSGEQAENGWIITIEKEWEDKNPINDTSEWKYNTWKYISKNNPLEKLNDDVADSEEELDIKHSLSNIIASQGGIMID